MKLSDLKPHQRTHLHINGRLAIDAAEGTTWLDLESITLTARPGYNAGEAIVILEAVARDRTPAPATV